MNIELLGNRVLVKVDNSETKRESGLVITRGDDPGEIKKGKVVYVGYGRVTDQGEHISVQVIKVGDNVAYRYGADFYLEGKPYQLVEESDVLMVLN